MWFVDLRTWVAQYVCSGQDSAHSAVILAYGDAASYGAGDVHRKWAPVTATVTVCVSGIRIHLSGNAAQDP